MNHIVPAPLLFDYRISVPSCANPARRKTGKLLSLAENSRLPALSPLGDLPAFATFYAGWNAEGFAFSMHVTGKKTAANGNRERLKDSDAVEIWIDTRPTGNVARATQYCHRLACLPVDEQANGRPAAVALPIPQQRESKLEMNPDKVQLRYHSKKSGGAGYELEVWIPQSQLYGYRQIDELRRLGFYCLARDSELGEQPLTIADDFPFAWNPSLWVTLELQD